MAKFLIQLFSSHQSYINEHPNLNGTAELIFKQFILIEILKYY